MKAIALQRKDRKTGKVNGIRWRFEVYNAKNSRNEPVPVDQVPKHIRESQDRSVVEAYCNSQAAILDSIKHRAEKLRKWKEDYHDFKVYLEKFTIFQREKAPNSFENDLFYLENYAFGYFLSISSLNNLNLWHHSFDEFRTWLKTIKPLKQRKKSLALNTQIKIIKSLNRFLHFCFSKGWIEQQPKCPAYSREETITVTADDTFKDEEVPLICKALNEIRPISRDYFIFLLNTGLRENEGLGISFDWVLGEKIDGQKSGKIHDALCKYDLGKYHGYICLESQPALASIRISDSWTDRHGKRWTSGSIPHKPLKLRKRIDPKYFRYIPIFDPTTWNIIVDRAEKARALHAKGIHGKDPLAYPLFDGLTASMFYCDLAKALVALNLKHRSPHKTRHSFLTWFYDKVSDDLFLADKIAGHRDRRDIERYCHLSEQIGREQKLKQLQKTGLKKVVI